MNARELRLPIAIVFTAFITFFFAGGTIYASGVLFSELLKKPCASIGDNSTSRWKNASTPTLLSPSSSVPNSGCTENDCSAFCRSDDAENSISTNGTRIDEEKDCGGFGQSRGITSWTSSVYLCVCTLVASVTGILVDRFGCRVVATSGCLILSVGVLAASATNSLAAFIFPYGIMAGTGFAFVYPSSIVIVSRHWQRLGHQSLANGLALSGMGVGTAAYGPIAYAIIKAWTWRGYLRFIGVAFVFTSILTSIFYKDVVETEEDRSKKRRFFDRSLFRNRAYLLFLAGVFVCFLGLSVPVIHTVRYALDLCICQSDADLLVTYYGVGSVLGRIAIGSAGNYKKLHPMIPYLVCVIACGLTIYGAPFVTNYAGFIAFMFIYGLFSGAFVSFFIVVLERVVDKEQLSQALGWALAVQGPPNVLAAPIAGWLYDASCSYSNSFYFGGTGFVVGFLILVFVSPVRRRYPGSKADSSSNMKTEISSFEIYWRESSV